MKNMKISTLPLLLVIFSVMLINSSCKKTTYNKLSEEEMSWIPYAHDEQMIFQSTLGPLRMYIEIGTKTGGYRRAGDTYNEFSLTTVIHTNDTTTVHPSDTKGALQLFKTGEGFTVTLDWPHFPIETELTQLPVITANVKGTIYTDIRLIDATAFANARFYVTTIWYSKKYGVVQYEDIFGRRFYRLS